VHAESLLSLSIEVASEQSVQGVLDKIVHGLAAQPQIALSRIWLLMPGDLCDSCYMRAECRDQTQCLHLVASASSVLRSDTDWSSIEGSSIEGHFQRVPLNTLSVGVIAATGVSALIEGCVAEGDWIARPDWAKSEGICSFSGHPLTFRGEVLGVLAVFGRQPLDKEDSAWLRIFANQAAVAIANARAFEEQTRINEQLRNEITERQHIENALRDAHAELGRIIDSIPLMVAMTSSDGTVGFINKRWQEYTGLTSQEGFADTWTTLHPDERARVLNAWQIAIDTGEPFLQEIRLRRADGAYLWFQQHALPHRDQSGKVIRWYVTVTNIEDRKQAEKAVREREQNLRLMVNSIPGMLATMTAAGAVEFVNQPILDYFGKTLEEIQNWAPLVHPDDRERALATWGHSIATGAPYLMEHRLLRADGMHRWFVSRGLPFRNTDGQILRWYVLVIDIDDTKRAEEALRQSQTELAHVNRVMTMGELASSIAHEVNQPLSAVILNGNTCLRWLSRDQPNIEESREAVQRMIRDAKRASEVITRIRALSKKTSLTNERVDLNDVIREIAALAQLEIQRKRVIFRTELPHDLPAVLGDRVQLQQVILNLVMNGIDAMDAVTDRPRELLIETQNTGTDQVLVMVQDSGTGIDPQNAEHIFDAFYTTKPKGMGLGLSVSLSIIQNHGGRLWLAANDGPGTCFQFTVPKHS
jgi:PAS domain S-box-containing protein